MVAFFDFFTYSVVALGIPLMACVSLKKEKIVDVITYSAFFLGGYGGMWCGKWIMSGFLIKGNTISNSLENAFSQVTYRMTAKDHDATMTVLYVLRQVLMHLNNKPMKIFALIFGIIIVIFTLSKKYMIKVDSYLFIYLIIALYPFIWYIFVKNHSATHSRIEQRELAVSIMAIVYSAINCFEANRGKKRC